MNKYFNLEDTLYDITKKYPETINLFIASGYENMKDEALREKMGKAISLKMALSIKNINIDTFTQKLVEIIDENIKNIDTTLISKENKKNADVRIYGVLPCPVKIPLMEGFNEWLNHKGRSLNLNIDYQFKAASGGVDWIKETIQNSEDEDILADIFISAGFDLFFDKSLFGKFKEKNVFEDFTGFDKLNSDFDNDYIDLKDPQKQYSMIGVVPAVFLINTEELDGRKMPESYEDILKPEYENRVSLPIGDFDLFNSMLLNIYKKYGEDGVKKLGKSLFKSMHPAEMVKSHIKNDKKPIVTIMPYFFTKMTKRGGPMKAVWPSDGAIISPIFMLTKKAKKDKIKPFVDFFASKEVGEILSHNGRFPSVNPSIDNMISKEHKYMWLGWDYINNNDIAELIKKCEKIFNEAVKKEEVL